MTLTYHGQRWFDRDNFPIARLLGTRSRADVTMLRASSRAAMIAAAMRGSGRR
jgi:hypothetical protein